MIILCADDLGLADGVSRGIQDLATAGRLSAASAMVTFESWSQAAGRLAGIRKISAVGLHLNLTLGVPLIATHERHVSGTDGEFLPLRKLTYHALTRRLNRTALQREIQAQITQFRDKLGSLPDFIDGHQHVHGLPVIRDALVAAIETFAWPHPPLIRTPSNANSISASAIKSASKSALVAGLTRGLRPRLHRARLPTNDTFSGFSTFQLGSDYRVELSRALNTPDDKCHLVMCHPGYVDDELRASGDPLIERRAEELAGLFAFDGLSEQIWHPSREPNGAIDWVKAMAE